MKEQDQNIAVAKFLGIPARRLWRVYWDEEKIWGSIMMKDKEEALRRIEYEGREFINFMHGPEFYATEPEEYDDWTDIPNYCNDDGEAKNLLNKIGKDQYEEFICILHCIINGIAVNKNASLMCATFSHYAVFLMVGAKAAHITEAFVRLMNLWEEEEEKNS